MKKFILYISLQILAFNICKAQIDEFPYLNSNQVTGVYNLGAEVAVLSFSEFRSIDNKDIYILSFLNKSHTQTEIVVTHNAKFQGTSSNNGETYFVFFENMSRVVDIVHLNDDYTISYTNYPQPDEDTEMSSFTSVETDLNGNLFLFRPYSIYGNAPNGKRIVKERGTEIVGYDRSLQEIGQHRISGLSKPTGFTGTKDGFVLNLETRNIQEKKYDLELAIFNTSVEMTGKHNLTETESYFPSDIISHNNQIIVAGYSLKGSIFESKATEGLFVRILGMDGAEQSTSKFSWLQLKEKLADGEKGDFIFNGKKNILIQKIIAGPSGYKVICESYTNTSGKTAAEVIIGDNDKSRVVTVYDFVIFETDPAGALTSVNILNKEKMNVEIGSSRLMRMSKIELAYHLKKHHAFPYRGVTGNKISFINYKNKKGYLSEIDILTGEITEGLPIKFEPEIVEEVSELEKETVANSKTLTKLDNMNTKLTNSGNKLEKFGEKLEYGIEHVDLVFNPYQRNDSGIYTLNSGQSLSYLFHHDRHSIYFKILN